MPSLTGRLRRMVHRNFRAASTMVATLLMVSITVTGAAVAYTWANYAFGRWQQAASERFEVKSEAIAIESVALIGTDAQIVIRNTGTIEVAIAAVYVDSVLKYSAPFPEGFVIQIGGTAAFNLTSVSADVHLFSVTTMRGYRQAEYWIPVKALFTTTTTIVFTTTYTTATTSTGTTTYTTTSYSTTTRTTTSRTTTTYTTVITTKTTSGTRTITSTRTSTVTSRSTTTMTITSTTTRATSTVTSTTTTTITSIVTTTTTTTSTQP